MSKSLTIAVVYDAAALNRDEKIGNNVLSIKKITRGNKIYSAISRVSQTHHIFNTLNSLNPNTWKETKVSPSGKGDKKVIQFDLKTENIITSAELDFFGYMGTESMNMRKSPVGMTKALSLLPWEGDLLFYANHGLIKRAKNDDPSIQPNPYSKEEHSSLYNGNVTVNGNVLGKDYWLMEEAKVEEKEDSLIVVSKKVKYEFVGLKKIAEDEYENDKGIIKIEKVKNNDKALKINFALKKEEREKRLRDFLKVIRNGIVFQSSGEAPGLNPVFLIAAIVDVPMPVFNGYVELNQEELKKGSFKIKASNINNALTNQYIQKCFAFDGIDLLDGEIDVAQDKKVEDWEAFVNEFLNEAE